MTNVLESLKSAKQVLYEKYILDEKGQLKMYSPITQEIFFKMLEANGLETSVKAFDKEMQKKEKDCE